VRRSVAPPVTPDAPRLRPGCSWREPCTRIWCSAGTPSLACRRAAREGAAGQRPALRSRLRGTLLHARLLAGTNLKLKRHIFYSVPRLYVHGDAATAQCAHEELHGDMGDAQRRA
jgi:hypothetical protein